MVQKFECSKLGIEGAYLIEPFVAYDERGYFIKDYSAEIFQDMGISHDIKEVFYTNSHKGVIRAIHFQREKQQPKLVRCVYGEIFDVVVDLRKNSPTFGEWEGYILSEENKKENHYCINRDGRMRTRISGYGGFYCIIQVCREILWRI